MGKFEWTAGNWYGDFERFRDGMRDLDQLLINAWNVQAMNLLSGFLFAQAPHGAGHLRQLVEGR